MRVAPAKNQVPVVISPLLEEIYADLYGISAISWIIFHLFMIAKYGTFAITEGNPYILWIEIGVTILVLGLMIERLIDDFRKKRGKL